MPLQAPSIPVFRTRERLPFPRFERPTAVDSLILCVRGGQYGHADIFRKIGERLVTDSRSVHIFLDAQRMDRDFDNDLLFRASIFSPSNACVPAIIEAPASCDVSVGPFTTIDFLRHRFRTMMAEHKLLPVLVVDLQFSNTRSRGDGRLVQPRGPQELLSAAAHYGIDTLSVSHATFAQDFRAELRRVLDEKNIASAATF